MPGPVLCWRVWFLLFLELSGKDGEARAAPCSLMQGMAVQLFLDARREVGVVPETELCSCITHASPLPSRPPTAIERLMGRTIPTLLRTPGLFAVSQLRL